MTFRNRLSIQQEALIFGFVLSLILLFVFGSLYAVTHYRLGTNQARTALTMATTNASGFVDRFFEQILQSIHVIRQDEHVLQGEHSILARTRALQLFAVFENSNRDWAHVYAGYPSGLLLINDYEPPPGFDATTRPWYVAAVASKPQPSVGLTYQDAATDEWLVSQSVALMDGDQLLGVATIDVSLNHLIVLMEQQHVFSSQRSYIITSTGEVIIHSSVDRIGETHPEIAAGFRNDRGQVDYIYDGRTVWAHYYVMPDHDWIVVSAVDRQEVLAPILVGIGIYLGLVLVVTSLFWLFQYTLLARRIVLPLQEMRQRLEAIVQGDSRPEYGYRYSNQELAEIANSVEQLTATSLHKKAVELQAILESTAEGILVINHDGDVVYLNRRLRNMWDLEHPDNGRLSFADISKKIEAVVDADVDLGSLTGSTTLSGQDGRVVEVATFPLTERGQVVGKLLSFRDATEERARQSQIEYLSFHDQLTGLYNRRFFDEEFRRLDVARNLPISLIVVDVNGLKLTNDAFGHETGDKLLQRVAQVLRDQCRADDILARVGGDEFTLLLPATTGADGEGLVQRIRSAFASQVVGSIPISVSCGCAVKTDSKQSFHDLYKQAEDNMYRDKISERSSHRHSAIQLIINTLYEKAPREQEHSDRVAKLCRKIGEALDMDRSAVNELETAGALHDIGKVAVSNEILDHTESLSEQQWRQVQRHSEVGYNILSSINEYAKLAEYVIAHHERWDGTGYPKGLAAEQIPLQARIMAVADAYDAMTNERPYSSACTHEDALQELLACAGTQFDPQVVRQVIGVLQARHGAPNT